MKDYVALYRRILERESLVIQDYVVSNLTNFQEHFIEANEFIDTLPVSGKQKEALHLAMEYHRLLVEDCLQHLENISRLCTKAMGQRFSILSPEKQRSAVSKYRKSDLFVIQGGQQ